MQLSESTGMFSANNPLAFNQNSDLIDIQGNHQPFNQMGVGYQNIAFIDPTVKDYQSLIAGIVPNTEIVLLDPTRDGVEQITQILADRTEVSSAHIITHGGEASLQLGTAQLSLENLDRYRASLEQWKNALTPDADILLYGCNVAAGEKGTAFVQSLSQITDADIAASDDLTGSAALGGDWEFEVKTGEIEANIALEAETMASYNSVLLTFSPATQFGTGVQPQSVTAHDFNGDGHLDLALPTRASGAVSILLGDSTGNFGKATNFNAGQYPFDVAVGNFNNDSFPDIAAANWGTSNVSILLGDGTGSFKAATNFSVGTSPWSVEAGDFNSDGKLDLATANIDSNNVSILLGDGTGSFSTATNFSVGLRPQFVGVGDFNADSKLDLATANFNSNNVSILLGTGTGSFGTATNFSVGTRPYALAVSDLNADGKADLAVANEGSSNVSVLLGTGTGSFGGATNFSVGSGPRFVAAGDLNADGKLDLATANLNSNNVSVLLGTGTGSFDPPTNFSTGAGTGPWTVAISDLNKDGAPDLATPNYWTNNVSVLINTTPLVNFGAASYSATEDSSDTVVNIPVTLSATPGTDVTVPIVINNGSSATEGAGNDYTLATTSVTFAAGATGAALTQNVAVTIKPDNIPENDEKLVLDFGTITAAAAGTTKQTTLTIAANDAIDYAVSAGVANIPEGNSGITPITFTVIRSGSIDAASKVDFAIGGTATNNSDYNNISGTSGATSTTGTITFAAGETQKTITMNIVGDTAFEPEETVIVNLSNPVAPGQTPTISNVSATTTVNNDDTQPQPGTLQFSAANFSVPEGNSGGFVNATAVTVNRTGGSSGAVSVQARVNLNNPGTANNPGSPNPNDYNNNIFPITVNFADGDTAAKTVVIPINGDTTVEPDETVNLELISGSVTGGATIGTQNTAILTISNDDANTPFTDINAGLPGVYSSSVAWGDYDNDGKLDILLTGDRSGSGYITKVYRNTGSGFSDINAGLPDAYRSSVAWGDYDNDGRLDILLTGYAAGSVGIAKVYRNTGSGFTDINAGLTGVYHSSAAWGDYDNDGKLDILLTGRTDSGHITKVYRNTGSGFSDINAGLTGVGWGSVAWGDYDNDGRLDILLTGDSSSGVIAKVYRNTGSGFTDINAGLPGVWGSSAVWGDYDNDGKLDILLTGWIGSYSSSIAKVYRNTGSGFTDINAGLPGVGFSSAAWGDYDNDGKLDILLTGYGGSSSIAKVYRNTGSGFTDINAGLTDVYHSSAAWGDYDNDRKLDILLTGYSSSGSGIAKVYRNNTSTANTPPTTPTGLSSTISETAVTLNWNPATDAQTPTTGLAYNLRVGTTPGGNDVFAPMSLNTGYRQVPQLGNTNMKTSWQLNNLTPGQTYYWNVQAIDTAWAGSPFATEGSFTVANPTPSTVSITTTDAEAAEAANGQTANPGQFSLTRTGNLSTPLTVKYTTSGTATNSTDYNNLPGSITFGANQSTFTLPINVINDNLVEGSETATVTITPDNAYTVDTNNKATVFIADIITVPQTINSILSSTDPNNPTRSGKFRDDYRLTGVTPGQQVQLNLNAPFDAYLQLVNADTGQVIASNDDSNGTLNSQLNFAVESGINYLVRVTSYAGGATGNYSLITAIVPPPTVTITAADANAAEVISGQTPNPGQFTISRTGSTANSLTVNYTTGGTATNSQDYNNIASSIIIPAGASSANLPINVIDDNQAEGDEVVSLTLIGNSTYNLGNAKSATVTIADNEPAINIPTISGSQTLNATLSTADPNNTNRSGSYKDDYRLVGVTPGQTIQINLNASSFDTYLQVINANTGEVITFDDDAGEGRNSQLSLTVQPGINYLVRVTSFSGGATGNYTLITSDPPSVVTITATDANAAEVVNGQTPNPGQFTITRTGNTANSLTVNYTTGGTATKGTDYNNLPGNIVIPVGQTSINLPINVIDDSLGEGNETAILTLAANSGYTIGNANSGTVTIADNEPFNRPPQEIIHLNSRRLSPTNGAVTYSGVYTDPDGDILNYTATNSNGEPLPSWLGFSFDSNNNSITFTQASTPPSNWQYSYVRLTATDPWGASASQSFGINKSGSGWVIDGYIAGSTIFFDANKNGVIDRDEPSTKTDSSGAYQLDISPNFDTNNNGQFDPEEGNFVANGGTDTATGLPLETPLTAPPYASVVTLLTSMVTELLDRGINPDEAESQVKAALSLPSDVNLTSLDPIAATNNKEPGGVEVLAAMVKVQNFITETKAIIDGAFGQPQGVAAAKNDTVQGIMSAIVNQIQSGVILDFTNPEQLAVIIEASVNKAKQLSSTFNPVVNSEFIASSANVMAQVNQRIDKIVATTAPDSIQQQIARVQKVALGEITLDFKAAASGTKSINELIAENTGAALNTQIQTARIPGVPAVPIINHLPKFDSTHLFDSDFYLQQNPDVADAIANKLFADALAHFSQFGYAEGRNPSAIFATDYLNKNSDVAAAVAKGAFHSGFEHFIKYGMAEGRSPAPEFMPLDEFYISANQDVAQAVSQGNLKSGIEHLMRFGMAENRDPFTRFNAISETFDPTFYLAWNQDVAEAVNRGEFRDSWEHFVNFGRFESRDPSTIFSNFSYLKENQDVAAAISQGKFQNGFDHYLKFGFLEKRKSNDLSVPLFF
ncbi:FG-GAP-like repeat-containing protein [Argonema antarcticum]|uniref:FG-GAP-like repeat-containing protein n=1 Tax=Argonema antarcticum TaxID=2942763 RepID=UPI002011EF47|nr:FG-GAP-like repeat-containing protein [Argonema antarcticum]MCL1470541.1 FG-GAP-like repeat-containing protein [Argonema antarcticum A004/B2]